MPSWSERTVDGAQNLAGPELPISRDTWRYHFSFAPEIQVSVIK